MKTILIHLHEEDHKFYLHLKGKKTWKQVLELGIKKLGERIEGMEPKQIDKRDNVLTSAKE